MNKITELNELIESELNDLNLILLEENEYQIQPYVDELEKKANSANKIDLIEIETFKVFLVFFYLTNNNVLSYDEAYKMVEEIRYVVNGWSFASDGPNILNLSKAIDSDGKVIDTKAFDYMTKLRISPEFINYDIKNFLLIILCFIKLKKDIMDVNLIKISFQQKIKLIKKIYINSQMQNFVVIAVKAVEEVNGRVEFRKKVATEKIKYTKEVQKMVDDLSILELDNISGEWHRYLEQPLLEQLYNIVFDNLHKKKEELTSQIEVKEEIINKTPLVKYLYSCGIDINSIDKHDVYMLEQLSLKENIVGLLDFLRWLGLSLNKIFTEYIDVLVNLTEEKVSKIQFFINSKVLSKETLLKNPLLFSKMYEKLLTNYEILKPIIDFDNMFYDDSILLESPLDIKNILSVLAQYELTKNNYIFLLCHFNYINIYDLLIEHEIPLYLFISICETENPIETIKRILIYREIGEEFTTTGKLLRKEVASSSKSLIDESLDDYLPMFVNLASIKGAKITEVLDSIVVENFDNNYRATHDAYMIGSVLISRPKFLRNFEDQNEDEDSLINCLVSESLLSEKEFLEILRELKGKRL